MVASAGALALLLLGAADAQPTRQVLYQAPVFGVKNTTNVKYAQGLTCTSGIFPGKNCTPTDLLLDVYEPVADGAHPVPERKPAYILSHGGGNTGGTKEQYCFQGSAGFMASRGFVAFNIDYRLKGANGLLPPGPIPTPPGRHPPPPHSGGGDSPSPPVAAGAKLVSSIGRSAYFFSPHPDRQRKWKGAAHPGPITLPGKDGKLQCVTPAGKITAASGGAVPAPLEMRDCAPPGSAGGAAQVWNFSHWDIDSQLVKHSQSGLCLDIAGVSGKAEAGLHIVAAPCVHDPEDTAHAQQWVFGWSGALLTRSETVSINVAASSSTAAEDTGSVAGATTTGWTPSWNSGYPAVRDLKAAIRFVRANADKYGVDASRIVVSGGSAGATNSVAAGVTFDGDYNRELTVEQDPTLATTHQEFNSSVQAVVAHWRYVL